MYKLWGPNCLAGSKDHILHGGKNLTACINTSTQSGQLTRCEQCASLKQN